MNASSPAIPPSWEKHIQSAKESEPAKLLLCSTLLIQTRLKFSQEKYDDTIRTALLCLKVCRSTGFSKGSPDALTTSGFEAEIHDLLTKLYQAKSNNEMARKETEAAIAIWKSLEGSNGANLAQDRQRLQEFEHDAKTKL